EAFPQQRVPVVLGLGTFDGMHLGHQALLSEVVRIAVEQGGRAAAITFDPHPLAIIAPPPEPFLLTTIEERLRLIASLGIDLVVVIRFDAEFRQISAQEWMELLLRHVRMNDAVCGSNYTFGRDRGGTVELLRGWAEVKGVRVHVVPPVHVGGALVGSTLIRRLLRAGDVAEAARYLGRRYTLRGTVQRGDARGRSLGFPTANLAMPDEKLIPGTGIYAAMVRIERGIHQAAVSIGTRPTFGPGALVVEAYLLEFSGDLYGETLELHFVQRLRDELAFTSEAALIRQMREDVAEAARLLAHVERPVS
ncbi:MAG: bifunctional riboflavin kinase/FAD synthetase, partial [Candidatus Omnitrophota bacterium]|nr:bifunctional riboflavin kinase/FAD synthetase [Candidatus Omnitrophota bacterium]